MSNGACTRDFRHGRKPGTQALNIITYFHKDGVEALRFPRGTVEAFIEALLDLKRLERLGVGRITRYRIFKQHCYWLGRFSPFIRSENRPVNMPENRSVSCLRTSPASDTKSAT